MPDKIEKRNEEIFPRIQSLTDHPDMGRVVPEINQTFLRVLILLLFRIVYRHDLQRVRIVRIRRSERLLYLAAADDEAS